MGLNKASGEMYPFITDTWNIVRGICSHFCTYCYMRENGFKHYIKFVEDELKTDLGTDKFIFVGSSCDLFAKNIPSEWIIKTIQHCNKFNNDYLLQTKNPDRYLEFINSGLYTDRMGFCTTIETNRYYPDIMKFSPTPVERAKAMNLVSKSVSTLVTIEPIMDFDLGELVDLVKICNPMLVIIGADSKIYKLKNKNQSPGNQNWMLNSKIPKLPEPNRDKILALINELTKFVRVIQKSNLNRLLPS
jgi:DNA repair photolyase